MRLPESDHVITGSSAGQARGRRGGLRRRNLVRGLLNTQLVMNILHLCTLTKTVQTQQLSPTLCTYWPVSMPMYRYMNWCTRCEDGLVCEETTGGLAFVNHEGILVTSPMDRILASRTGAVLSTVTHRTPRLHTPDLYTTGVDRQHSPSLTWRSPPRTGAGEGSRGVRCFEGHTGRADTRRCRQNVPGVLRDEVCKPSAHSQPRKHTGR